MLAPISTHFVLVFMIEKTQNLSNLTKDCLTLLAEVVKDHYYREILNQLDNTNDSYFQSVLNYLYQLDNQGSINEQDVMQFIKEQIPEKETVIMSIAKEIEQRGVKKGMQKLLLIC